MSKTLQLKRITNNYDTHKSEKLANGEPLIIETPIENNSLTPPFIVIGDGDSTIAELVGDGKVFVALNSLEDFTKTLIQSNAATDNPLEVGSSSSVGTSSKYAKGDHIHSISKETIVSVLGEDSTRKITAGIADPIDTDGDVGDIYIKYE